MPTTYVYKISATMPDGSILTTSRMSRRAAKNVAKSYVDGREPVIGSPFEDNVDDGRPPALFVSVHVGTVTWADEATPFPGDF